jgi:glutaminyl-peptide cyclotransferase
MRRTAVLLLVLSLLLNVPAALLQDTVIEKLVPDVLADFPHDPGAFTQGILFHDGLLYESTGQYGQSSLRQVDPETGEVLLTLPLPDEIFAEGLALVDETYLYQITWREQVALRFNLSAFTEGEALDFMPFEYEGQGWGLCYDGELLVMSNGSDTLALRDPETFEVVEEIVITFEDVPLSQLAYDGQWITEAPPIPDPDSTPQPIRAKRADLLNELECVDDSIYANIWQTDLILRIDRATGAVTAQIDAAGLLDEDELPGTDVLNGIVFLPDTETFLITGKYWPRLFEVNFVPVES